MTRIRNTLWWLAVLPGLLSASRGVGEETRSNVVAIEPSVALPEAAREKGQHGELVLEGDLVDDVTISQLAIIQSTGSPDLDHLVIEQVEGKKIPRSLLTNKQNRVRLKIALYAYQLGHFGGDYFCDQAVKDFDWYASAFPAAPFEKGPLYHLLSASRLIGGSEKLAFTRDAMRYEAAWRGAVEECRKEPQQLFVATLAKHGNA